ncbi:MAG: acyl carrier protein [Humibacter sp.]
MDISSTIRETLSRYGNLSVDVATLSDDDDLYQAGLTSHASVNVMLSVEDAFGVEFPDSMLTKDAFRSVTAISDRVKQLGADATV